MVKKKTAQVDVASPPPETGVPTRAHWPKLTARQSKPNKGVEDKLGCTAKRRYAGNV